MIIIKKSIYFRMMKSIWKNRTPRTSKAVSKFSNRTILTAIKGFCRLYENPVYSSIKCPYGCHYHRSEVYSSSSSTCFPAIRLYTNNCAKYSATRLWCSETPWILISIRFSNNGSIISTMNRYTLVQRSW